AADIRASLGGELRAEVDGRLDTLPALAADAARGAVAAATPALRAQITADVNAGIDTRMTAAEARFDARADALETRFAQRDAALSGQIDARVAQELPGLVNAGIADASGRLSSQLDQRVSRAMVDVTDRVTRIERRIGG